MTKKPFTTAENLIKPCTMDVCAIVFGKPYAEKIKHILLPDNTINVTG
jgi:hypothetical protein